MHVVVGNLIGSKVPAAIIAGQGFFVARRTKQWPAQEELVQTFLIGGSECGRIYWQRCARLATGADGCSGCIEYGRKMVAEASGNNAFAKAQGAAHA